MFPFTMHFLQTYLSFTLLSTLAYALIHMINIIVSLSEGHRTLLQTLQTLQTENETLRSELENQEEEAFYDCLEDIDQVSDFSKCCPRAIYREEYLREICMDFLDTVGSLGNEGFVECNEEWDEEFVECNEEWDEAPEIAGDETENSEWVDIDDASELEWEDIAEIPELAGNEIHELPSAPTSPPTHIYEDHATSYLKTIIQENVLFGKPLPPAEPEMFTALLNTDSALLSLWLNYFLKWDGKGYLSDEDLVPEEEEALCRVAEIDIELRWLWLDCYTMFEELMP